MSIAVLLRCAALCTLALLPVACGRDPGPSHPPGDRGELELCVVQPKGAYPQADELRALLAEASPRLDPVARFPVLWAEAVPNPMRSMGGGPWERPPLALHVQVSEEGTTASGPVSYGDFTETYSGHTFAFVYEGQLLEAALVEGRLPPQGSYDGPGPDGLAPEEVQALAGRMQTVRPANGDPR